MDLALVDKDLKELIRKCNIVSSYDLNSFVQPASIDLPVGDVAFLIKEKVLPFNKKISEIIDEISLEKFSLKEGTIFLKGQTYLIPCVSVDLPKNLYASISPKSSIGRIDMMVRSIFDNSGLYDTVSSGKRGQLWLEVTPQSFNVRITSGIALNHMKIFREEQSDVNFHEEKLLYDSNSKLIENSFYKDSLILSLDMKKHTLVGYEAISTNEVIDLTKRNFYSSLKFFREVYSNSEGKFILEKDRFYILTTKEKISIPLNFCAEMVPFSHLVGELRAHYAGFFDPGFGYGKDAEIKGATGVLEVRPHETITVFDGQPICLMDFFRNSSIPEKPYGYSGNNYQSQEGPKLAKYFKK